MQRGESPIFEYGTAIISPILIMGMMGSLLFFLVQACYGGAYNMRLSFILALFSMAAVLIARIAIEEGRAYAEMFAFPLALVSAMALARFVQLSGPLESISFPVNMALLALIWWGADRLVFDCTIIDDEQDDSGSGLLQTIGLDSPANDIPDPQSNENKTNAEQVAEDEPVIPNLFEWLFRHNRKKQQPGIWVLYFSLGAVPLFGIGQWFTNAQTLSARRNIFQLLVIYLICSLTLLAFTSLLSLRRYLRQREVEIPISISATWIGTGGVVILTVLLLSYLLPRRNAEYSITHLDIATTNANNYQPSKNAVGNDGELKGENARTSEKGKKPSQETTKNGTQPGNKNGSKKTDGGKKKGGGEQKGKKGSSSNEKKTGGSGKGKSDSQNKTNQKKNETNKSNQSKKNNSQNSSTQKKKKSSQTQQSQSGSTATNFFGNAFRGLMQIIQYLYWLIAIAVIAYLVWKNWDRIKSALSKFWEKFWAWWNVAWFGKKVKEASIEEEEEETPRPTFADFPNPFQSGRAEKMTPDELIQYSYDALQAWAEDANIRQGEPTPNELANQVGAAEPSLASDSRNLATLVAQSAYSPENVDPAAIDYLRSFWKNISATSTPVAV